MKYLIIPGAIVALIAAVGHRPTKPGGGPSSWDKPTWMKSPFEAFLDWFMGG